MHTSRAHFRQMSQHLCTGSARLLVRQNGAGNGFRTWRRLSRRFSLPDATRLVSLLTKLRRNTDSVLVATLMSETSGALQEHLCLNAATINTFQQMTNTLVQYFRSRHFLTSWDSGLEPMDIGALKDFTKEKAKCSLLYLWKAWSRFSWV